MKISNEKLDRIIALSKDFYNVLNEVDSEHKINNQGLRIIKTDESQFESELEFRLIDNDIYSSRSMLYEFIGELSEEERIEILCLSWLGREGYGIQDEHRFIENAQSLIKTNDLASVKRYICYSNLHDAIPEALKKINI